MNLSTQGFKVKTALISSMLLVIVGMTTPAYAGEQGKVCKHDGSIAGLYGRQHERHITKALSLTEEQQQTLKSQRETQAQARQQLREQTRKAEEALISAVNSGANDSELQILANELGKLKATASLERAKSHKAFLAVLTPEQQQALQEMKAGHKDKKGGWHGKYRGHRGEQDS